VVIRGGLLVLLLAALLPLLASAAAAQDTPGSLRGSVRDQDFDTPLAGAQVLIVETGQAVLSSDQGQFVLAPVAPGSYTLVVSKEGYVRRVKAGVVVSAGQLTEVGVSLAGEFTEMEEFLVQDVLQPGAGSEIALLNAKMQSPAFIDSIGSELMSQAGASDAASALKLVSGASLQDGKSAVIRGLPDRYVSSQINGVRLPSADEDKRAVELDQFPAAVIESMQVSKTFTPDQQGDASGGAVNVRLKSIPDESFLQLSGQLSANSQVYDSDFLSYDGGGIDFLGDPSSNHDQQLNKLGQSWSGAVGTDTTDPPQDYKVGATAGGKLDVGDGVKIGGLASLFYERDSSFIDDGKDDSYWVTTPGAPMTPQTYQGTPTDGDFKTALYDITQGTQTEQWGGLGAVGIETENNRVGLTYLYTRTTDDTATLAIDTRGKEFFFPGYDPNDPSDPGNQPGNLNAAPYLRTETLEYTQRTTDTLQLDGEHTLPFDDLGNLGPLAFKKPQVDWVLAGSSASLDQPDKRQFGALWLPESNNPGAPPFIPPFTTPETWFPYKPAANFTLGNLQRIWKTIDEDSNQYAVNLKLPFDQWSGDEGYLKFGLFDDQVDRTFTQDTFSNFNDPNNSFEGGFDEPWSAVFPEQDHPITESLFDVDYDGDQQVSASYSMLDLPLSGNLSLIGGARFESTEISIVNHPEANATWFPPGSSAPVALNPGDADVSFDQDDVLPSVGLVYEPVDQVTLRASYSQTVARQTFKELTPIIQQEFLGGPIFVGNPDLQMSALKNYDLRCDYTPYDGGLLSASWFSKDIDDPIEYVQRLTAFTFTTPVNYPEGELSGIELEGRQQLGRAAESLEGVSVGANATFIDSKVTLPDDEAAGFASPAIQAQMTSRDMTDAPEHLYNLYLTWEPIVGTNASLFYTVTGDTLVAGAGESNGNFVPNVYAKEYGTLNFTFSQRLGEHSTVIFQAKNLTNPDIEEVYRSDFIGGDVTKTSYTAGREFSLGFVVRF
jgi:TonB-dependent receptor